MQCSQCQHENPPGQKFCGECGTRLPAVCPACQTPNPPTNKFCGECGGPLAATAPRPAVTAPAPTAVAAAPAATVAPAAAPPAPASVAVPAAPTPATGERFASPESYTPKHLAEKILTSRSAIEGERKQVTVMFTDVSGFTAMSERLDPEEVHAIMDRAFEVILAAVHEYEGTINQFLGDGVMALFGAPIAHEDHAGRAVRAALAIQQRLEPLRADVQKVHGREFRMRIGLNSGPVVVGAIGRDLRMDYTAVGDTVNLAARLMSIAQPGQVVISSRTRALCEGYFVFDDLGKFELKGKSEPVPAFAALRELGGRTRLEVSRERGLTPLVGRVEEQARLTETFRKAAAGEGGVILISGDPGVGKSRLLYEFLRGLDATPHLELETTCVSFGRAMAYRPMVELYRHYLAVKEGLSVDTIQQRVADCLGALGLHDNPERALLFHHFLGLPVPEEFLLRVQGANLRDRTIDLLSSVIERESEHRPVILVIENVHWIDASSAELLRVLIKRVRQHRIMLVLTMRPESPPDWLPPSAQTITLEALDSAALRTMVGTLLGTDAVTEPLFQLLLEKGEGNPLYVEEILRQLQETGGIVTDDGVARLRGGDVSVPESIRDIIAARVDRLAESPKHSLQVASVIGRRFGVSLVSRVRASARDVVAGDLRTLHGLDFVFPSASDPEPMYSFKHALTQDVVYGSLLERRRRLFHADAGRGLEELYAGRIEDVVELLAYHFDRSGDDEKAVDYAIVAAGKAQRRWANTEALAQFETAIARLASMPDTEANARRRIDAIIKQGEVKFALGRHAEHVHALESIKALVDTVADPPRRASWYYWAGFLESLVGGSTQKPIAYCREALRIAEESGVDDIRPYAECSLAHVLMTAGELDAALEAGERALATFEARGNVWWACRSLWALSPVANYRGEWERGLEYCRRALAHGQAANDLRLKVVGWWRTGSTHIQRGDAEAGLRCCDEALALSPIAFDAAMIAAVRGYGFLKAGEFARGTSELTDAVAWFERSQLHYTRSLFSLWLAEGHLALAQPREARRVVDTVLGIAVENGYRHLEGVAERLLGEILGTDSEAIAHFDRAHDIVTGMNATNDVAKVLVARARYQVAAGDVRGARENLAEAEKMFLTLGTSEGPRLVDAVLRTIPDESEQPSAAR